MPKTISIDFTFEVLALKLIAIVFKQIFHFHTLHPRKGLYLQNGLRLLLISIVVLSVGLQRSHK